jgi:hypothetical protein
MLINNNKIRFLYVWGAFSILATLKGIGQLILGLMLQNKLG